MSKFKIMPFRIERVLIVSKITSKPSCKKATKNKNKRKKQQKKATWAVLFEFSLFHILHNTYSFQLVIHFKSFLDVTLRLELNFFEKVIFFHQKLFHKKTEIGPLHY